MAKKRILHDVTDGSFRWIDADVVERAMLPLGAPLPDEYYRAIGRITVNFSVLEGAVAQCVGQLLSNDQGFAQVVTSELSFKLTMTILHGLVKRQLPDKEKRKPIDDVLNRARAAEDKRNMIIHSEWSPKGAEGRITRIKFTAKVKRGLRHKFDEMSAEDLESIADEIRQIYCDLKMLFCPPGIECQPS